MREDAGGGGERVEVRRAGVRRAEGAELVAQIVDRDEEDVRARP
jgi:hypothetical protein